MKYYKIEFKINFHDYNGDLKQTISVSAYVYGNNELAAFNKFHKTKNNYNSLVRNSPVYTSITFSDEVITELTPDQVIKIMNEMY